MVKIILLYTVAFLGSTFGVHLPNDIYGKQSEVVTQLVQNSGSNSGLIENLKIRNDNPPQYQYDKYILFKKDYDDFNRLETETALKEKLRLCINEFRSIKDNTAASVDILNKKVKKNEDFDYAKVSLEDIFFNYELTKNATVICIYDTIKKFNDFKTKSESFEKSFYNRISEFMNVRENYVTTVRGIYKQYLNCKNLNSDDFIEHFEEIIINFLSITD
ncbi:hypothetical protein BB561_006033 [Smittium simulii]|uniref:Uncharacterized protein n=1 Tax=Smittium simulii TaxID=133385 RepID=A0A2T9Y6X6_9FUNG|nr:hypothetical protein BB561_006033 [Smittium simulii]